MSLADELVKLDALKQKGALSEEEYKKAVARQLVSAKASTKVVSAINRLHRSRTDRWLGGVCGGLASATSLPNWVWRILFVVLLPFHIGWIVYLLLWGFAPVETEA